MTGTDTPQRPAPFSLLLPVYEKDEPEHFARAFSSSVAAQTLPPDEVVLVQDGDVPEALEAAVAAAIASTNVPIVHIRIPERGGLANALTAGLAACSFDRGADGFMQGARIAAEHRQGSARNRR